MFGEERLKSFGAPVIMLMNSSKPNLTLVWIKDSKFNMFNKAENQLDLCF